MTPTSLYLRETNFVWEGQWRLCHSPATTGLVMTVAAPGPRPLTQLKICSFSVPDLLFVSLRCAIILFQKVLSCFLGGSVEGGVWAEPRIPQLSSIELLLNLKWVGWRRSSSINDQHNLVKAAARNNSFLIMGLIFFIVKKTKM